MKSKVSKVLATALLVTAGLAGAATRDQAPFTGAALERQIQHEILMYPNYSIWDDINFRVRDGQVELYGAVNQPYKKSDVKRIVRSVPGVTGIADQIRVLPLS